MPIDLTPYLAELISVSIVAIFMAISPGADFVMVTRNSIFHGRNAGLYSSLGISLAIWIHVAYSIAGLAIIISNSILLFSIIKYLGAAYLIYIGWKTFSSKAKPTIDSTSEVNTISNFSAFKIGFITNALNPKTTIFFLSLFTQVIDHETPLLLQIIYGAIISLAHLLWFCCISVFLSHPILLKKFEQCKNVIEKCIGSVLIAFGLKVATSNLQQ
jgi:RhtB (resistance to homoserine/threonine) family protein